MLKRILLSAVLISISFFSFSSAQKIDLKIKYLFTIGEGLEFEDPGFLITPQTVATHEYGNIFISDHATRSVKMYSKKGDFIDSFGRGGRGPGEFNRLSDITIDHEGRLLVLDRMSFKVARFNLEDGSVEEHYFEDMNEINMMAFVSLENDRFAGVYLELGGLQDAPIDLKAIRVYKFGNGEKESSHYEIFNHLFDKSKPIEERVGGGIGHKLTSLGNGMVAVGHYLYKGKISIVNLESGKVIDAQNPAIEAPYYLVFENRTREELVEKGVAGWISSSGRSGSFRFQIFNYSHLLEGSKDLIFHIFNKNEPNGPMISRQLEIFSKDGELKHMTSISDYFQEKESVRQNFLHIDENLRLFVRNSYEQRDAEILVYQLKLNGIEE